jgi:hypothetical protein
VLKWATEGLEGSDTDSGNLLNRNIEKRASGK